jgi:hypothetical protein
VVQHRPLRRYRDAYVKANRSRSARRLPVRSPRSRCAGAGVRAGDSCSLSTAPTALPGGAEPSWRRSPPARQHQASLRRRRGTPAGAHQPHFAARGIRAPVGTARKLNSGAAVDEVKYKLDVALQQISVRAGARSTCASTVIELPLEQYPAYQAARARPRCRRPGPEHSRARAVRGHRQQDATSANSSLPAAPW